MVVDWTDVIKVGLCGFIPPLSVSTTGLINIGSTWCPTFRYSSSFSRVYGQQQPSARMSSFLQAPHSCSQWPSRYDQCVYGKTDWWTVDDRLQIQIHRPYFLHAVDIIMSPRSASMSIRMLQEFDFYNQRFYISNRYNDHESINRSGLYEFNFQRLLVLYWYAAIWKSPVDKKSSRWGANTI